MYAEITFLQQNFILTIFQIYENFFLLRAIFFKLY